MRAMILAAGEGKRLMPLTKDTPKVMLTLWGKPILERILLWLKLYGITEVAISLHHKQKVITDYFGDGTKVGMSIRYSRERKLLGTAGSLSQLRDFFTDTFLVVNGDTISEANLYGLIRVHYTKRATATIGLYKTKQPCSCGIVGVDNDMRINRFVEKPSPHEVFSNMANVGIIVMEPRILYYIPDGVPFDIGHDLIPLLLWNKEPVYGYHISSPVIDIGTSLDSYKTWEKQCKRRNGDGQKKNTSTKML